MKSAIEIENLSIIIDGHKIIKNVSAKLVSGRIIGLIGPSGSGKTTLIKAIVGTQKFNRGYITIQGYQAGDPFLRSQIGYMPQSSSIYTDLTVSENLNYFASMCGYSRHQAVEVIKEVDLMDQANLIVKNLSGGQKSRVALAAALLGQPPILVLDEPTVGVDPLLRIRLWGIFKQLAHNGTTLLITSHIMDEANHCEDLLLIRSGKLLAEGTPHQLREATGSRSIEESFIKLVENI